MTRTDPERQSVPGAISVADHSASRSDALQSVDVELWPALEYLSRALHVKEADLTQTLDPVLSLAIRTVPGARFAGLNLLVRGNSGPGTITAST